VIVALVSPWTPTLARVGIATVGLVTLIDPVACLLLLAVSGPLGSYLAELLGIGSFRLTDAMLLSFIGAWLARRPARNEGPRLPRYATIAGWLFGVVVVSLAASVFRYPNILRTNLLALVESTTDAARMLEGLVIATATIDLFRQRPSLARSLPAALALSATAAALTGVLLWLGVAPHQVLARHRLIGDTRLVAYIGDLNAAGTHFATVLCLALGMSVREHGPRRRWWIGATLACALGLWMTGSRSAEAAIGLVIPVAALWAGTASWLRSQRLRLVASVLGVLMVIAGVIAWRHHNFLQMTTETSIIGLALFAAWFAGGLQRALSALASSPRDWRLLGAASGIVAFLGTCLAGHPLVVPEVALAVFLQFGLMAGLGASHELDWAGAATEAGGAQSTPVAF
jgi:hypothetical protein